MYKIYKQFIAYGENIGFTKQLEQTFFICFFEMTFIGYFANL